MAKGADGKWYYIQYVENSTLEIGLYALGCLMLLSISEPWNWSEKMNEGPGGEKKTKFAHFVTFIKC